MKDSNNQKRNFERYMGTRKYKLSFWGLSPNADWIVLVFYIAIGFILIALGGYYDYKNNQKELSEEIFVPREAKKFDLNKIDELLYEYGVEKREVIKELAPVDQNQ